MKTPGLLIEQADLHREGGLSPEIWLENVYSTDGHQTSRTPVK